MPKKGVQRIHLPVHLLTTTKKEDCLTKGEIAWLETRLRRAGSTITHRILVDLIKLEHICSDNFQKEVDLIAQYLEMKRGMVRKFDSKIKTILQNA